MLLVETNIIKIVFNSHSTKVIFVNIVVVVVAVCSSAEANKKFLEKIKCFKKNKDNIKMNKNSWENSSGFMELKI